MKYIKKFENFNTEFTDKPRTYFDNFDLNDENIEFDIEESDWSEYPYYAGLVEYFINDIKDNPKNIVKKAIDDDVTEDLEDRLQCFVDDDLKTDYSYQKDEINNIVKDFIDMLDNGIDSYLDDEE